MLGKPYIKHVSDSPQELQINRSSLHNGLVTDFDQHSQDHLTVTFTHLCEVVFRNTIAGAFSGQTQWAFLDWTILCFYKCQSAEYPTMVVEKGQVPKEMSRSDNDPPTGSDQL